MLDLTKFTTEQRNQKSMDLDTMTSLQIVTMMNDEDLRAVQSVTKVLPQVAAAIDWAAEALERGGRVFYMGAGTSGRLGVLDASECPPTFGVSPDLIVGLIAGGETAFIKAVEGPKTAMSLARTTCESVDSRTRILSLAWRQAAVLLMWWAALRTPRQLGARPLQLPATKGRRSGRAQILPLSPCPVPRC